MDKLLLRSEHVEQLDAVPIVAAERVVTKHLQIVDDEGRVRIDALANPVEGEGPRLRLFNREGDCLAILSLDPLGVEGGSYPVLFMGGEDDSEACLCAGSLKGAALDVSAGRGRSSINVELLASLRGFGFLAVDAGPDTRTIMQIKEAEATP